MKIEDVNKVREIVCSSCLMPYRIGHWSQDAGHVTISLYCDCSSKTTLSAGVGPYKKYEAS